MQVLLLSQFVLPLVRYSLGSKLCVRMRVRAAHAVREENRTVLPLDGMSVMAADDLAAIYTRLAIPPLEWLVTNGT